MKIELKLYKHSDNIDETFKLIKTIYGINIPIPAQGSSIVVEKDIYTVENVTYEYHENFTLIQIYMIPLS